MTDLGGKTHGQGRVLGYDYAAETRNGVPREVIESGMPPHDPTNSAPGASTQEWISHSGNIQLRFGRWQDRLADVEMVDAVITDAPYSPRTHAGRRCGDLTRETPITYDPITPELCAGFIASWAPRVREWIIVFGDDTSAQWWKAAMADAGLYVFAPLPWVKPDAPPRMSGDGPSSAAEHIVVARQKVNIRRPGSRPGYYERHTNSTRGNSGEKAHPGTKPLPLMVDLVCDYTEPGDLICDPFAGSGTTLRAADVEGRRCVGAECVEETYRKAVERLTGYGPVEVKGQRNLFAGDASNATR